MSARLRRRVGHWVGGCARAVSALAMAAALAGCGASSSLHTPEVMEIAVLGFNDFHGNLEPPRLAVPVPASTGASQVPAGGAAYFAGAVAALKAQHPHHLLVSAGDMVGASPLVSALFLDEPTIHAFNLMGVDFHAQVTTSSTKAGRSCCACSVVVAKNSPCASPASPLRRGKVPGLLERNFLF